MNKLVVNVLGLQRSGTSMLSAILAHGPGVVSVGEIVAYYRITRHRKNEPPPESFPFAAEVPANVFHREVMRRVGAHAIIDSSKSLEWALEVNKWYGDSNISVYNVLIWKNPEDQLFSQWKRGLRNTLTPRYYGWPYYHRRLLRSGVEFISVNYRELVYNPESIINSLCEHIGLEYFRGKEKFWKEESKIIGSSPGVKKQINRGKSSITKEKWPAEYNKVAKRAKLFAYNDTRVINVIRSFEERSVKRTVPANIEDGHRFEPSFFARVEQKILKYLKTYILRFRWNTVHNLIGWSTHKKIINFIKQDVGRKGNSFDPGND